jgi:ABC-type Fe3+ transport system permease subunit
MMPAIFLFAKSCPEKAFLGFPSWYHYLNGVTDSAGGCTPQITGINDVWLIVAAIIEILLQVAAIIAVGFVAYGGFLYLTSQGDSNKAAQARQTIINAIVGVVITVFAAAVVGFLAGSIKK